MPVRYMEIGKRVYTGKMTTKPAVKYPAKIALFQRT
jgi:hypothetical protein